MNSLTKPLLSWNETILCAIDFSDSSIQVLKYAVWFAECSKTHLTVLFSYRLIHTGQKEGVVGFKRKMEEEAVQKFKELERKFIKQNISHGFIAEIGFLSDNIESYARKSPISLLVLSRSVYYSLNDHNGLSFDEFLNSAKVPLLVVPD